ncbi:F0F1 ATP synthase subunit A [Salisaeta longa]|uniref:F0F1 ATP synthase subunit A n=1 Tax=Salisaeta longa TaxID=503170 RepID=UPI0009FFEFB0|nr:F0F1 ATP synthase subunit A [Salisaeta longa]
MSNRLGHTARFGFLALALMLFASPAAVHAADGEGELTVTEIVNNEIIGHAADGNYISLYFLGKVELPRVFLARTADGSLTLDAYASTKAALKSGVYGLVPHHAPADTAASAAPAAGASAGGHGGGHGSSAHGASNEDLITTTTPELLNEALAAGDHLHSEIKRAGGSIVLDFSPTRHFVFGIIAMLVVLLVFLPLAQRYKEGVGRNEAPHGIFQNMMEVMVVFIRDDVAKPNLGDKYRTFMPFLLSAFFFILVANILGLVPFFGAATSNIAATAALAVMTLVIGQVYGSADHFKHLFTGPSDAPIFVRIILVPIEIIGLLARHLALAVRLFANMLGGALVIFSFLSLVFIMKTLMGPSAAWVTTIFSVGFTVFVLLLKLLVAFIQAYVFTALSAVYIGMAVEEHHGEEGHLPEMDETHDTGAVTPELREDRSFERDTHVGEPVAA